MERAYKKLIAEQFSDHQQMVLLSGARQVGKTTLALSIDSNAVYFNWDDINDREILLQGPQAIAEAARLNQLHAHRPVLIFDEIHKYGKWKPLIKGFYDKYKTQCAIFITGSARMDVYKKGGDSLMGRYFNYRLHPLSVLEVLQPEHKSSLIQPPQNVPSALFEALLKWGGFPEPFLKKDQRFFNRWSKLREQQLLQEDIRELTRVQELGQFEILAVLLKNQAGQLTSYSKLAKKVRVSVDTIRRWMDILESIYYCYSIRPWSKNITRSILKEPKYYLWDWSQCVDEGARNENFIASHLLKAVHYWTDSGIGDYGLYFLRDKEKREVDFLVTCNNKPWFIVEVKSSMDAPLSKNLAVFAEQLQINLAFQVAINGDYIELDVFKQKRPVIVPAKTFLSQLV